MMNNEIKKWFEETPWREGVFAFGVQNPDGSVRTRSRAKAFANEALENALRNAGSLFQNLERTHLNFGRTCLVFKNGLMHAERRLDGACLVFFTARDDKAYDADGLEKLFAEFRKLKVEGETHEAS